MHPTALFYAPAVAWGLLACAGGRRLPLHAALGVGLVAVWFAPILLAPDTAASDARATTTEGRCAEHRGGQVECAVDSIGRIGRAVSGFQARDVAIVLRTAYVEIPLAAADSALPTGFPRTIWAGALAIAALVAISGLALRIASGPDRLAVAMLAAALLAGWAIATAMREYTAFWACYFILPLSALVFGAGFDRWMASASVPARWVGRMGVAIALAAFGVSAWAARAAGEAGVVESRLPLLGDLKRPQEGAVRAHLATAAARDALAREICAVPSVTLHGELAYALGGSAGLDLRMHCPSRRSGLALLGPAAAGEAWTALPVADAGLLRKQPRARLKGLAALSVKRSLHPEVGTPIDPRWDYFERLSDRREMRAVRLEFATGPGEAVMVYRLKPFAARWHNFRVLRNGITAAPALATYNAETFVSDPSGPTAWRVEFDTDAPHWVDVHVF
jgi:hypothetical protein